MTDTEFGFDPAYRRVDRRRLWRAVGILVAAVVALNLVGWAATTLTRERVDGPAGSSFVTTEPGLGAFHELLEGLDRPVERLRVPLDESSLDPATTLVVYLPDGTWVDDAYLQSLGRHVEEGGVLITTTGGPWFREFFEASAELSDPGGTFQPFLPLAETEGVGEVIAIGDGVFRTTGNGTPMLTNDAGRHLAVARQVGAGRVFAIADPSVLSNEAIAMADNAAFAVGLTGGRPVVFDEYVHGYGAGQGLDVLGSSFGLFIAVLSAGFLLWTWAVARRIGPPEQPARALPPRRGEFLDALGSSLARTSDDDDGFGSLRLHGLRLLNAAADRRGSGARATTLAGTAAGLTERELDALSVPISDTADALLVGTAVAKLERMSRRKDHSDE